MGLTQANNKNFNFDLYNPRKSFSHHIGVQTSAWIFKPKKIRPFATAIHSSQIVKAAKYENLFASKPDNVNVPASPRSSNSGFPPGGILTRELMFSRASWAGDRFFFRTIFLLQKSVKKLF